MRNINEVRMEPMNNQGITDKSSLNSSQYFTPNPSSSYINFQANQKGVYDQLNQIFEEQDKEKKTVFEAREILGKSASTLTDEQVYNLVNEIQYVTDTWLEEFEQKIFDGKTLKELLEINI